MEATVKRVVHIDVDRVRLFVDLRHELLQARLQTRTVTFDLHVRRVLQRVK